MQWGLGRRFCKSTSPSHPLIITNSASASYDKVSEHETEAFMNFWLKILICAVFVAVLYLVFRIMMVLFADSELFRSELVQRKENAIEIFAEIDSLEYYLRLALAASDEIAIVVYIGKGCAYQDEMTDIVTRMHREHKNVSYRLI